MLGMKLGLLAFPLMNDSKKVQHDLNQNTTAGGEKN